MAKSEQNKRLHNSLYQKALDNAIKIKESGKDITLLSVVMLQAIEDNPDVIVDTVSYFADLGFDSLSVGSILLKYFVIL